MKALKTAGAALITAALMLSAGCAQKADWIESTLVTVDVTGVWEGTAPLPTATGRSPGAAVRAVLDLEQEGPKVKGTLQFGFAQASGPLEGRVSGDVFRFIVTGGQGETSTGEVTVNGDAMEGTLTGPTLMGGAKTVRIFLHRAASPPRLQSN